MTSFVPINLPVLTAEGVPIKAPSEGWKLAADLGCGVLTARSATAKLTYRLSAVLAAGVTGEEEVRAFGATLKRMYLTGAGAELMSNNRNSGLGASILDYSLRGAETQTKLTGFLVWPDLSVVQFTATGDEIDSLYAQIPANAFTPEYVAHASGMIELVSCMKADGVRALQELADEVLTLSSQAKTAQIEVEKGATFEEREQARQWVQTLAAELETKRSVCAALMNECNISAAALLQGSNTKDAGVASLLGSRVIVAKTKEDQPKREFGWPAIIGGIIIVALTAASAVYWILAIF